MFSVESAPKHVPSPPEEVTLKEVKDNTVALTWLPPTQGHVTGYKVLLCEEGKNKYKESDVLPADVNSFTSEKLKKGKTYKIKVVALNEAGQSEGGELETPVKIPGKKEEKKEEPQKEKHDEEKEPEEVGKK